MKLGGACEHVEIFQPYPRPAPRRREYLTISQPCRPVGRNGHARAVKLEAAEGDHAAEVATVPM
jgi:hypothetical protein